jgi:transcriptional regulator with XRE-family HTH domain
MPDTCESFAWKVQTEKDRRGWSVRDLAKQAGVTPASADLVVTGRDARLSVALRIAEALGLDTADLGKAGDLK